MEPNHKAGSCCVFALSQPAREHHGTQRRTQHTRARAVLCDCSVSRSSGLELSDAKAPTSTCRLQMEVPGYIWSMAH